MWRKKKAILIMKNKQIGKMAALIAIGVALTTVAHAAGESDYQVPGQTGGLFYDFIIWVVEKLS